MDEVKQVKVDNWGTFFLQRLKHFFNRTDYCDLTLQFQDKAQLKVHRLVLSACTEYFELLERTCEMYEDCLVMPDDLQADVVVPIVNFMYTGSLEFSMDILEKLYQTSLVMNMPVLTTLLESHRTSVTNIKPPFNRNFTKHYKPRKHNMTNSVNTHSSNSQSNKRPYTVAFEKSNLDVITNKVVIPSPSNPVPALNMNRVKMVVCREPVSKQFSINKFGMSPYYNKRLTRGEPKPTRCELPEELENDDNSFTNTFMNISYESKPLVVHPETTKSQAKTASIFNKASTSRSNSVEIMDCKKISRTCSLFDDNPEVSVDYEIPQASLTNIHNAPRKSAAQLFDQIVENQENDNFTKPKVTIETTDSQQSANLDHAKIISEVLKKYPHLVNSNKNIKLKVLNTHNKQSPSPKVTTSQVKQKSMANKMVSSGEDKIDYIDRDMLDTKEAGRLIALGIDNVVGPWICLMCGTPSKALRFGSYYYYRRHLVEVHHEKPATRICEYCGLKTPKRNVLVHHLLTKHGVEPPMQFNFPKCNMCSYIGLTEANLAKHKMNHAVPTAFKCNVCTKKFSSTNQLLAHIQQSGHKYTGDRKADLKCLYCLRVFIREGNLYSHIKANHRVDAIRDGVIDDCDDEKTEMDIKKEAQSMKHEIAYSSDYEEDGQAQEIQYVSQKLFKKKPAQKILNPGFPSPQKYQTKAVLKPETVQILNKQNLIQDEYTTSSVEDDEMVDIDGDEYFVHNNQLVKYVGSAKKRKNQEEFILPEMTDSQEFIIQQQHQKDEQQQYIEELPTLKKLPNSHQPVQIVVSNDEEYDNVISSNSAAIYDVNTNKTLTVLTTPDTATLAPTCTEVPDTVPNSMMLIADDYPLTVSADNTTSDSNIMIVYTEPAEINNKSYQIITTGNGEHYVQTTDAANNFETIPASVINDNDCLEQGVYLESAISRPIENPKTETAISNEVVIMKKINETLPAVTLPQQIVPQTCEAEGEIPKTCEAEGEIRFEYETTRPIENPTTEAVISNEMLIVKEINETLPVVTLPQQNVPQTSDVVQDDVEMSQTFTQDEIELQESQKDSNIVHEDEHIEQNTEHDQTMLEVPTEQLESSTQQVINKENDRATVDHDEMRNNLTEAIMETVITETDVDEVTENALATQNDDGLQQQDQEDGEMVEESQINEVVPEVVNEQIQTLTSEWSEDEAEIVELETGTETDAILQSNNESTETVTEPEEELEESIENIQKVMDKHNMEVEVTNTEEILENPICATDNIVEQPEMAIEENEKPSQEKISSLLNDWEDNDSQEEANGEENEKAQDCSSSEEVQEEIVTEQSEAPKDDKIKSLVSDWDDEEEELKE